jgi:predicted membrane GTPase involved in stress response
MPDSVLRVLTCGSVDDGKSTLIGRLLFECGTIPDDVMAALERDSKRFGTVDGATDYALLVDGLEAEREQGVTIDVAYRFFETPSRRFILADTPGHQQYTRNMVTGASTADLAVLLIDARKGILPQTRRHAAIASLLGIRQVVLASVSTSRSSPRSAMISALCLGSWSSTGSRRFRSVPATATMSPPPVCGCPGMPAALCFRRWRTPTRRWRKPVRFACRYSM